MKDGYDFSKAIKNPFAKDIKENGYTTSVYYSPEYISERIKQRDDIIKAEGGFEAWLAKLEEEADDVVGEEASEMVI